jgi:hypothetical protein
MTIPDINDSQHSNWKLQIFWTKGKAQLNNVVHQIRFKQMANIALTQSIS